MITITTPGEYFFSEYSYIINCIFSQWLSADYRIVAGHSGEWLFTQEGRQTSFPNIFFPEREPEEFYQGKCIPQNVRDRHIVVSDLPFPFALPDAKEFASVDILGTIFFFLTCYEDTYTSKHTEFNGTLAPSDSYLFQAGIIHRPVIDEMIILFYNHLKKNGIHLDLRYTPYRFLYSCDVDMPTLCYGKNFANTLKLIFSAIVKHHSATRLMNILKSNFTINNDLFFTFPWILQELHKHNLCGCFNLKGGRTNRHFDHDYDLQSKWIKKMILLLIDHGQELGFHPSYQTPEDISAFRRELANVRKASPIPVRGGRQHFLRFFGSSTWKMWDDAGLEYDSTVGFNKVSGFRLGTAREFPVYDLQHRKALKLRERPLIAMDCTLLGYEGATPQEAFDRACGYAQQIRKYGGNMTLLWHNSSLETPEKRELFSQLLKYLA